MWGVVSALLLMRAWRGRGRAEQQLEAANVEVDRLEDDQTTTTEHAVRDGAAEAAHATREAALDAEAERIRALDEDEAARLVNEWIPPQ